jgi:hypothetical protein
MIEPTTVAGREIVAMLGTDDLPYVTELLRQGVVAAEHEAIAAERARLRKAVGALPGWRDPRYSGMYESPGLVDRNAVLALFEGDDEPSA